MTMLIVAFSNFAKAPKNRQGKIYHAGAIDAYGGVKAMLHPFLTLVLHGGCVKFHVPAAVPPGRNHMAPASWAPELI